MHVRLKKLVFFANVLTNIMYTTRQQKEQFENVSLSRKARNTSLTLLLVLHGPHRWEVRKDTQTKPMTSEEKTRES